MGIVAKVKILLGVRKPVNNIIEEVKRVKSGYKTTEFWLTVLSNLVTIVGALNGVIDAKTGAIVLAVLNGIYTTLRTIAKAGETSTTESAPK